MLTLTGLTAPGGRNLAAESDTVPSQLGRGQEVRGRAVRGLSQLSGLSYARAQRAHAGTDLELVTENHR